ncbi:hypothetical protein P12x_003024 [Tundrisphaera lichenicola]|uniref:hypothetical protein n=1 Tax=Tundrisphaera lichenicola TaxID=2029860 RepID=UPI003EBDCBEB
MNPLVEAAQALGIALSCTLSGAALAVVLYRRRSVEARARHVARKEVQISTGWFRNAVEIRLAEVEAEARTHHSALNVHGLMQGSRIVPDHADRPRIFRPEALNGETGS